MQNFLWQADVQTPNHQVYLYIMGLMGPEIKHSKSENAKFY